MAEFSSSHCTLKDVTKLILEGRLSFKLPRGNPGSEANVKCSSFTGIKAQFS